MISLIRRCRSTESTKEMRDVGYWEQIPNAVKHDASPKLPWLLLPQTSNFERVCFYDFEQGKTHTLNLPSQLVGAVCCGSSKGWLIFATETYTTLDMLRSFYMRPIPNTQTFLFDPISGDIHEIPSLATIFEFGSILKKTGLEYNISSFVNTIQISSTNIEECVIGGVFAEGRVLAFCRVGDEKWSVFKYPFSSIRYGDLLFCDGSFNVSVSHVIRGNVPLSATDGLEDCQLTLNLLPRCTVSNSCKASVTSHLVQSVNGELLSIHVRVDHFPDTGFEHGHNDQFYALVPIYKSRGVDVQMVDPDTGLFEAIGDLGEDEVIFLMQGSSCSLSLSDSPVQGIPGNNIYFVNNCNYISTANLNPPGMSRESGIPRRLSVMSWFLPNMKK